MVDISHFLLHLGFLILLFNTSKDMIYLKIDSRKTYFMIGATLFAYIGLNINILIFLAWFLLAFGMSLFWKKSYAKGDLENLFWIIPALYTIGFWQPFIFIALLGGIGLFVSFIKMEKKASEKATPGLINFLGAYILILGIYWYYSLWPQGCAISFLCF